MIFSSEKNIGEDLTVMQGTVIQCWQAIAQAGLILRIDIRNHYARSTWKPIKYHSPRINDHAVTVSFPAIDVIAALSGRNDICKIFNGAGTDNVSQ